MDKDSVNLESIDTVKGADAGFELKVKAPDGAELPGFLRVRGFDSAVYQELVDEHQRKRLNRISIGKTPTIDEMKAEGLELAAALVIDWTVPFKLEGKPFEYSMANALHLLKRYPSIREQVEKAAGVRANFLPKPAQG